MKDYSGFSRILPRFYQYLRREYFEILEPLLLFAAFFLPGYLFQGSEVDPYLFDSPSFHLVYTVQTLPLILLTLFIISRKSPDWRSIYRIGPFLPVDTVRGFLIFLLIWIILIPWYLIQSYLATRGGANPPGAGWALSSPRILPLVFLTSLVTGYWEELFFRVYLDRQLQRIRFSPAAAGITVTLLFGAGHLYQGLIPALGTAIIGTVLLYTFRRTGSIHTVAIAHGLYNFSVLSLSLIGL